MAGFAVARTVNFAHFVSPHNGSARSLKYLSSLRCTPWALARASITVFVLNPYLLRRQDHQRLVPLPLLDIPISDERFAEEAGEGCKVDMQLAQPVHDLAIELLEGDILVHR